MAHDSPRVGGGGVAHESPRVGGGGVARESPRVGGGGVAVRALGQEEVGCVCVWGGGVAITASTFSPSICHEVMGADAMTCIFDI